MVERTLWLLLASIIPMWVVEAEASSKAALGRRGYTGAQAEIKFLAELETAFAEAEYEFWLDRLWSPHRKIDNHLKQWLFKHGYLLGVKPELLAVVAENWESLTPKQRKQIADASQLSADHIVWLVKLGADAPSGQGKKLAKALEAFTVSKLYPEMGAFGVMLEKAYGRSVSDAKANWWYKRWLASLVTPESPLFPIEKHLGSEGQYSLRFVPRNNPERLFAGVLTNCCQHPQGEGAPAAWYAQEAPNASVLALYKDQTMVAQALVWSQEGLCCFDSIEGLSVEMRDKFFEMLDKQFEGYYTLGNADLGSHDVYKTSRPISVPADLEYTDANTQYVSLRNKDHAGGVTSIVQRPFKYNHWMGGLIVTNVAESVGFYPAELSGYIFLSVGTVKFDDLRIVEDVEDVEDRRNLHPDDFDKEVILRTPNGSMVTLEVLNPDEVTLTVREDDLENGYAVSENLPRRKRRTKTFIDEGDV